MDKIACPKCGHKFELTEAVAGPLVAQQVEEARKAIQATADAERVGIQRLAEQKATEAAQVGLRAIQAKQEASEAARQEAESLLRENEAKLTAAQAAQAEAMRKTRELDEARRELELTVERKVNEGAAAVREEARRVAEEAIGLRVSEKEQVIAGLQRALEDAQRKAAQGSQQTQGEVQELALEAALKAAFPLDVVMPVAKGVSGADCVLSLPNEGSIIFESKRTKNWSEGWVAKLKDDQRVAGADVAVLVTTALPKDVADFALHDGVWVCLPRYAVNLTTVLRVALQEVAAARAAGQGSETKAELIYGYVTGPKFKSRVSAIVEAFTVMREDLEAERRVIQKQWAKREAQLERVLGGTVGMYGDLQAVAGRALTEIEGLSLPGLEGEDAKP